MSKKKNFPIRIPRYAKGIRAQNLRTGGSWWEKRWLASLAGKDLGGRLGRGKNYALSGQVVELKIDGPHVEARVLGMRAEAYRVTADFRTPTGAARKRIVAALKSEPMLVARMLANDLPTEVEAIFRREGCDLFPGGRLKVKCEGEEKVGGWRLKVERRNDNSSSVQPPTSNLQPLLYDMTTRCTCPDYANPCKHAHAVLLLLGEEVARHPATLIELRGIPMEELY